MNANIKKPTTSRKPDEVPNSGITKDNVTSMIWVIEFTAKDVLVACTRS